MNPEGDPTVLMVALCFPPSPASGTYRAVRFARHLPAFGWKCVVSTIHGHCHPVRDERLMADVSPQTQVERFSCRDPAVHLRIWGERQKGAAAKVARYIVKLGYMAFQTLAPPDTRVFGARQLYRCLAGIIQRQRIDVVWITGPPFSYFCVAPALKRRFDVPIVFDLRDPWTVYELAFEGLRCWRGPFERRLERKTFAAADRIILNTEGVRERYRACFPARDPRTWEVITNGFDLSELRAVAPERFGCKTLVHGGLTSHVRTSRYLIEAMGRLRRAGELPRGSFKYVSYGIGTPAERSGVRSAGVEDVVEWRGQRPHHDVLAAIRGADALLLLVAEEQRGQIPGKVYEYLGIGQPLIMAGPTDSDAARLLCQAGVENIVPMNDVSGLAGQLRQLMAGTLSPTDPHGPAVAQYDVQNLTGRLAGILSDVARRGSGRTRRDS